MKKSITRLDYCQYLLVSPINYTLTHFAEHREKFSHDAINRYWQSERLTPRLVWDNTAPQILPTQEGYVVFDDTVLDKNDSDDSGGTRSYQRIDTLIWNQSERKNGKVIKIKGFPKDHQVRCFWVKVSTHRTDWIVTNDPAQNSTEATQEVCGFRWKIEPLHREGKQLTGLERCQCRKSRIQRNHIACALLVWVRLKELASQSKQTVYQLKRGLLYDYLGQQLKRPSLKMSLA